MIWAPRDFKTLKRTAQASQGVEISICVSLHTNIQNFVSQTAAPSCQCKHGQNIATLILMALSY